MMETCIALDKVSDDIGGRIGRAIIHDDSFPLRKGLCVQRIQRVRNRLCCVIRWDDD